MHLILGESGTILVHLLPHSKKCGPCLRRLTTRLPEATSSNFFSLCVRLCLTARHIIPWQLSVVATLVNIAWLTKYKMSDGEHTTTLHYLRTNLVSKSKRVVVTYCFVFLYFVQRTWEFDLFGYQDAVAWPGFNCDGDWHNITRKREEGAEYCNCLFMRSLALRKIKRTLQWWLSGRTE